MTYQEVARVAGYSGAARAVGTARAKNYNPSIPCHRVIRFGGKLGEYNRGARQKKSLLQSEGFII